MDNVKQQVISKGKPHRWQKGECPNPHGRPVAPEAEILRKALVKDQKKNGNHLIDHAIQRARTDNTLLAAILKKIIPDKLSAELQGQLIQYIIDYKNVNHTNTSS